MAALLRDFQEESIVILRRSFSDYSARVIDALMWGWWSSRLFHQDLPLDQNMVRRACQALVDLPATRPVAQ